MGHVMHGHNDFKVDFSTIAGKQPNLEKSFRNFFWHHLLIAVIDAGCVHCGELTRVWVDVILNSVF